MPKELEDQMLLRSDAMDDFSVLYNKLISYSTTKHSMQIANGQRHNGKNDPDAMDVDALGKRAKAKAEAEAVGALRAAVRTMHEITQRATARTMCSAGFASGTATWAKTAKAAKAKEKETKASRLAKAKEERKVERAKAKAKERRAKVSTHWMRNGLKRNGKMMRVGRAANGLAATGFQRLKDQLPSRSLRRHRRLWDPWI